MATVFLGLGSNVGVCLENLAHAVVDLQENVSLTACSTILQTKPLYVIDQPDFYNQVIQGETNLSPLDLLIFIKNLEQKLGRVTTFLYGPRIIDVDILYYDQYILNTPHLQIPHPKNHERTFILTLMQELAPEFRCPHSGKLLREFIGQSLQT